MDKLTRVLAALFPPLLFYMAYKVEDESPLDALGYAVTGALALAVLTAFLLRPTPPNALAYALCAILSALVVDDGRGE